MLNEEKKNLLKTVRVNTVKFATIRFYAGPSNCTRSNSPHMPLVSQVHH